MLLTESNHVSFVYEENECSLVVLSAGSQDGGVYTCTARNLAGEVSCKAELAVHSGGLEFKRVRPSAHPGILCERPPTRNHSPGPSLQTTTSSSPSSSASGANILASLPCLPSALPVPVSCPGSFLPSPPNTRHLSSAQTAMEVEGVREDEEQRGRRLSDFYDIHQEIGRCGARRGCGVRGPREAGPEAQQRLSPVRSPCPHPGVPSPTCGV